MRHPRIGFDGRGPAGNANAPRSRGGQQRGGVVMGQKRANSTRREYVPNANRGVLVCVLASVVLLSALALNAAPALALPEGREYEQVSPEYKGGYGATSIEGVSQNGESVAFYSPGVFAGAPSGLPQSLGGSTIAYLARRGGSGWSTVPLRVPDTLAPDTGGGDISPTLDSVLVLGYPGPNIEAAFLESAQVDFLVHQTDTPDVSGQWGLVGTPLETIDDRPTNLQYRGASPDFCHILFAAQAPVVLLAEAEGASNPLYELTRGCNGEPSQLRLVALDNAASPVAIGRSCHVNLGVDPEYAAEPSAFNAVAAGGSEIFFTTCVANNTHDFQLFVRLGGERTVEVSRPLGEECGEGGEQIPCKEAAKRASASFVGASEDGSRVFFTTAAPLAGGVDNSVNLYMASIGCPPAEEGCEVTRRVVTSLVRVSQAPSSCGAACEGDAEVQGAVSVSPDGQRLYFVARGVLSGAPGPEGRLAVRDADNLYVYDSATGNIAFIGDLCSGSGFSGDVEDPSCPRGTSSDAPLWDNGVQADEAQTTGGDGRFLVFSTYGQLAAGDDNATRDVYRYDAVSGSLLRVSTGENGYDADGNEITADAAMFLSSTVRGTVSAQYRLAERTISEDGSRIVFATSAPLSPQATGGFFSAYEWHDGRVSLVSGGGSPVDRAVISPSGSDIFFVTSQGLVPGDTDGAADVYDAHLCSAAAPCFAPSAAPRRSCQGDACQGPLKNPAPLLVPGSAVQETGGNFAPPSSAPAPAVKAKAKTPVCKKRSGKQKAGCARKPKARRSQRQRGAR